MKRKRGNFFTFLFSLIPGAGEMYLGFFKQGTCLMSLFIGSIICASMLFSPLVLIAFVIWFYSFFHTNNINYLPDEEFAKLKDDYLFHISDSNNISDFIRKNKKLCSFLCIFIGVLILYYTITDTLIFLMPIRFHSEFQQLFSFLPKIFLGIGCILVGYYLIRGKKIELFEEEFQENSEEDTPYDDKLYFHAETYLESSKEPLKKEEG